MKFVRFTTENSVYHGVLEGDEIKQIEGDMFHEWTFTGKGWNLADVTLNAPLIPSHIIGIGANFVGKEDEKPAPPDMPVFFFKPASSVIGPEEGIKLPRGVQEVKFEAELAVVIGKKAKNISEEEAFDYVFGYTVGNDVTSPDFFHENGHWTLGKSFDTFTPLGPVIETELNPEDVFIRATVDGVEKQNSHVNLMIVSTKRMIAYLSQVMTLQPGDVILTGSPVGAEMVRQGATVTCSIEGIGELTNQVSGSNN